MTDCTGCKGTGDDGLDTIRGCPECDGTGKVQPPITPDNIFNVAGHVLWQRWKRWLGENTAANQDEDAFKLGVKTVFKGVISDASFKLVPASQVSDLHHALTEILIACEKDCGRPTPDDGDDEAVGASKGEDGEIKPMALTFGMLRRARAALEQ
jgi:hypothetical protein